MEKTITRNQIIKALKTEPLMAGAWIHEETKPSMLDEFGNVKDKFLTMSAKKAPQCNVCAVGAVLRSALGNQLTVEDIKNSKVGISQQIKWKGNYMIRTVKDALDEAAKNMRTKQYLPTLSGLFETLYDYVYCIGCAEGNSKGAKMKALRYQMVKFVQKNFPKEIKIEI